MADSIYKVTIVSSLHGEIKANLPQEFSLNFSSEWDSLTSSGSPGLFDYLAQEATGTSLKTQVSTAQRWSGNSPITLTLPLAFEAVKNAEQEVIGPIKRLGRIVLPRIGGSNTEESRGVLSRVGNAVTRNFLKPPGPRLYNVSGSNPGDIITIKIGRYLVFQRVILTDCSVTFSGRMDPQGYPMGATVEVTFKTFFSPTSDELDRMLLGS